MHDSDDIDAIQQRHIKYDVFLNSERPQSSRQLRPLSAYIGMLTQHQQGLFDTIQKLISRNFIQVGDEIPNLDEIVTGLWPANDSRHGG